ncbi:PREDICTED: uncharacterized protein LOC104816117 [Tarenaya hassleriana]|uniref:uncharacterized protein LOC104810685 n=1 Tax=Tarenaya hassleriana TaxID=28532 RepID=UPI00053C09F5|nr:PREDICTED: uncharacterized protein LOC104810685 [Tarenaya hassleriana]XP_010543091.1 PREDICTED: uncharacterized protein LOC104816117 [Tarenaya hassleriana]
MKIKNKGKVYPSPPSSSLNGDGFLSVLKLLPAAILVLASALSADDREVLAYLITRSLKTTTAVSAVGKFRSPSSSSSSTAHDSKKKRNKSGKKGETHQPPEFDCECFDCYTSYWFRWDSSPNRELIHQAIEAFEDHLIRGEASASASSQKSKRNSGRGKKKEKSGRRGGDKPKPAEPLIQTDESAADDSAVSDQIPLLSPAGSPGRLTDEGGPNVAERKKEEVAGERPESSPVIVRTPAGTERKGLARKVLPDVLGLFNSRFWSLWNPNA